MFLHVLLVSPLLSNRCDGTAISCPSPLVPALNSEDRFPLASAKLVYAADLFNYTLHSYRWSPNVGRIPSLEEF